MTPTNFEWNAITPAQAIADLRDAATQIREHAAARPGVPITCQVLLTLPAAQPTIQPNA